MDNGIPVITEITVCDLDDSELCVVTFGTNDLDRMVINFQLPDEDYQLFYVKASNRGIINVYSCEVDGADSTSAYCTGIRTPLGEAIEIEVYTTDGDVLIARGEFIVSALLLSTPLNSTEILESETDTSTPSPTNDTPPTETEAMPIPEEDLSTPPPENVSPDS